MPRSRLSQRYVPTLEAMESRLVPAGNVSVYIRSDILYIIGDNAANQVSVESNGANSVSVTSLDGTTTINRQAGDENGTVIVNGGRRGIRAIRANLNNGDDVLNLSNFALRNDIDLRMGLGNDTLAVDSVSTASGRSWITTSSGNDIVDITSSSFRQRLDLLVGSGNDRINLIDSFFDRRSVIHGESGIDTLGYVNNRWGENAKVEGFESFTPSVLPTAFNDTATVGNAGSVTIDVSANDTASSGSLDLTSIVITTEPTSGSVVVNGDGTVTYTHDGSASTSDFFRYTISSDDGTVSNVATVNLTIDESTSEAPLATNDTSTLALGGTATIDVAGNDSATVGTLDLASVVVTQQPTRGTVTVNGDGTITYVNNGTVATSDSFRYTIADDGGNVSNEATVNITLTSTPTNVNAPVATNDTGNVIQGGTIIVSVLNNDTDLQNNINPTSVTIVQQPANGSIVFNGDGSLSYIHNNTITPTTDTFTYTVTDFSGLTSNVATVTISITGPTAGAPVATNDTGNVNFAGSVILNLLANDSDPQNNINPSTLTVTQQPASGTVVINANGTATYTHNGVSTSTTDSFTYTVSDFTGLTSNTASVVLNINLGTI